MEWNWLDQHKVQSVQSSQTLHTGRILTGLGPWLWSSTSRFPFRGGNSSSECYLYLFMLIKPCRALSVLQSKNTHTHTHNPCRISAHSVWITSKVLIWYWYIYIYYDMMHCCPLVKGHQKVSCGSSILKSRWYRGQISCCCCCCRCCCCCCKEQFETIRNYRKWSVSQSELHSAMFRHVQQEILETVRIRKCIFAVWRLLRCKGRHWTQQQLSSNARHAEQVSSAMSWILIMLACWVFEQSLCSAKSHLCLRAGRWEGTMDEGHIWIEKKCEHYGDYGDCRTVMELSWTVPCNFLHMKDDDVAWLVSVTALP